MKIKRIYIQLSATVFFNIPFLATYLKNAPSPVFNCYACPLANTACPIGLIQNIIITGQIPLLTIAVLGFLGILLARFFCGYLCPFGFIQDLLFKISKKEKKIPKWFAHLKYVSLGVLVIILPLIFLEPVFCKLCPAGTLEAGIPIVGKEYYLQLTKENKDELFQKSNKANKIPKIKKLRKSIQPIISQKSNLFDYSPILAMVGFLFYLKLLLLFIMMTSSIYFKRPFCKVCPLGAIYSFFNKINLFNNLKLVKNKCSNCNACLKVCPSGINPVQELNSHECIKCNECAKVMGCNGIVKKK